MKNTLLTLTLFTFSIGSSFADISWKSTINKEVYEFSLTEKQFAKLPEFDVTSDKKSSLARNKAIELANKAIIKLPAPKGMKWQVSSISLYSAKEFFASPGKWLWRVSYSVVPILSAGGFIGELPEHEVAVLMDGEIISGRKVNANQ